MSTEDDLEELAGVVEYLVETAIEKDGREHRCDAAFVQEPTLGGHALRAVVLIDGEPPVGDHRAAVLAVLAQVAERVIVTPRAPVPL